MYIGRVYECDKCKKEIVINEQKFTVPYYKEYDDHRFNLSLHEYKDFDLCHDCYNKYTKIVDDFFNIKI